MNSEYWTALFRHLLTTLGSILVTKGFADAGTMEAIIGGIIAAWGLLWSLWHKKTTVIPNKPTEGGTEFTRIIIAFALLGLSLGVTGCVGTAAQKSLNGLKGDKASVIINLDTLYGKTHIIRIGDTTNRFTFMPDGTIKVNMP